MIKTYIKWYYNEKFNNIPGGKIDLAHHDTNAMRAMEETLAFDDAVSKAFSMTSEEDTLIVVSADHSHVFSMGGYASLYRNVLGVRGLISFYSVSQKVVKYRFFQIINY